MSSKNTYLNGFCWVQSFNNHSKFCVVHKNVVLKFENLGWLLFCDWVTQTLHNDSKFGLSPISRIEYLLGKEFPTKQKENWGKNKVVVYRGSRFNRNQMQFLYT